MLTVIDLLQTLEPLCELSATSRRLDHRLLESMRLVGSFRRLDEFDSTKYTRPSPIAIVVLMILPPRYSHFLRPVCFSIANKLSLQTLAVSCVPLESYQYGVPLN